MTFADAVLVRLADPATRAAVFDAAALEQIAAAAYDTSRTTLAGPYAASFDEFELGFPIATNATIDGQWGQLGGSDRQVASFTLAGLRAGAIAVTALWRGHVIARIAPAAGRIADVQANWPDPAAIDRAIVAALGTLPADPVARDTERRNRLMAFLKAEVADSDVVTDPTVDRVLRSVGAASVNEWFERYSSTTAVGAVQVAFADDAQAAPPSVPKPLPITAAVLVPDLNAGLARILAETRTVREQLTGAGVGRTEAPGLPVRQGVTVVWILADTVFQDAAWPGADADARRAAAGVWLGREGIGLAVTT